MKKLDFKLSKSENSCQIHLLGTFPTILIPSLQTRENYNLTDV